MVVSRSALLAGSPTRKRGWESLQSEPSLARRASRMWHPSRRRVESDRNLCSIVGRLAISKVCQAGDGAKGTEGAKTSCQDIEIGSRPRARVERNVLRMIDDCSFASLQGDDKGLKGYAPEEPLQLGSSQFNLHCRSSVMVQSLAEETFNMLRLPLRPALVNVPAGSDTISPAGVPRR